MKRAKIMSVVNYKGGTGKTTVTYNFAKELVDRKNKVLLIDLDGQGNLSKLSGITNDVDSLKDTVASMLRDIIYAKSEVNLSIYKTNVDGIDIIPCNVLMADTKTELMLAMSRETALYRLLEGIKELNYYDYILIDNAPSVEIDFINSLVASDEILIIASPDTFSTEGTYNLLKKYELVKKHFNKELKIAGILINNADLRTKFTKDMVEIIKRHWQDIYVFNEVIGSSIKVREATAMQMPISTYDKNNKVAISFSLFTDEYLKRRN